MAAHDLVRMTVSGTPGTGTVTLLAADTGALTFALGGVLDGERVTYGIVDGSNHEVGVGIYTAAGTTLSRSIIRASTNAGAAISATSSAKVYVTNSANDNFLNGFAYFPGKYYPVNGYSAGGNTLAASVIVLRAFYLPARIVVSEVSFQVTTTATGNYVVGIYANNPRNFSATGAPVWTSGSIAIPATGMAAVTTGTPFTLDAGLYWTAVNCSVAGMAFSVPTGASSVDPLAHCGVGGQNAMQFGFASGSPSKSSAYGALPTLTGNPTTDGISNNDDTKHCPNIQLLAS